MCGIAGYIGRLRLPSEIVGRTLELMKNRGPDIQSHNEFISEKSAVFFLHSRLSIIDLDPRSNQPFRLGESWIIFNGEIYNYLEIKSDLEKKGISFRTNSDTEVLLQAYLTYGESCTEYLEGMWSFAIFDSKKNQVFASRDRFGEKPFYYFRNSDGVYFGSEVKFIHSLLGKKIAFNYNQLLRYSVLGYKSLYKYGETYFENLKELPAGHSISFPLNQNSEILKRYWKPDLAVRHDMSLEEAIDGSRARLIDSMKIRLRSDVPLAFCLSGGVDSASLASIAAKIFNYNAVTFSIIDSDERYNEEENIRATIDDIGCGHHLIHLNHQNGLKRLSDLIQYHDAPIATITYYVHSMLSEAISREGYRVAFSGTSADELFTGYYDHFILHLNEISNTPDYADALENWKKHILSVIRNPVFRNPALYSDHPEYREHIFDGQEKNRQYLKKSFICNYEEKKYTNSLLRNRMMNELFTEVTPVILHEDDLNSMKYSIENRSPFLDSKLMEFAYSIPAKHLIKDGQAKYVLREAVKGILNEKVRTDRVKKGFNASIHSIINFRDKEVREYLLDPDSEVFEIFEKSKIETLINQEFLPNDESKFLFNFVNLRIFLEKTK